MAKKSNPNTSSAMSSTPSLDTLLLYKLRPPPVLLPVPSFSYSVVRQAGDRRFWQPDRTTRPPHAVKPGASRVVAKNLNALRFADPRAVALCARRKIRKQVMFALRRTKKGSSGRKHRNFWSSITC